MSWLLAIGLKNAILALPLAALALALSRWRRPALAHLVWAIVLVKLLTPPLIDVPVGWRLDVEGWLANTGDRDAQASGASVAALAPQNRSQRPVRDRATKRSSVVSRSLARVHSTRSPRNPRNDPRVAAAHGDRPALVGGGFLPSFVPSWPVAIAIVWIAGSLAMLSLFLLRAWRFRRYLRLATGRDEYLGPRVAELAHSVGLTIPPRVIVVDGIVSPMLWGLGQRACLIFPSQLVRRLSPANLDALLLHELAHYSRGDHWIRALEMAAFVAYWWNPVVWFARREIEAAEEECCDAWVVEHQRGTRHSYAEALLTTIDFLCERPPPLPPIACGLGEVELLRVRLTQIMRGEVAARLSRTAQAAVLAVGVVVSPLDPAVWARTSPLPMRPSEPPPSSPLKAQAKARTVPPARKRFDGSGRAAAPQSPASQATSHARRQLVLPPPPLRPAALLWATASSSNGRFQLEARSGGRTTLAAMPGNFRLDLSAHQIRCASFAPDSRWFATGHVDALVRLWDSETGGLETSLTGSQAAITSIHVSPDGAHVAAGAQDGSVLVWTIPSGEIVAQLPGRGAAVSCVRWSPNGDRLAITLGDFLDKERAALVYWSPLENAGLRQRSLEAPVGALAWLGDDALLVAEWSGRGLLRSAKSGESLGIWQVEKDRVSAAAWSADCPLVSAYLADQFFAREGEE